ncbi:uncharacterized protein BCR38DRAFT_99539 [Pseudomassariella vexata]|uniref:Uncharacterized protein n=1 Tax=Pseudomassariella vexata TaxID=1141098 RepID=A0A1Y2EES9_9PEZI|nr:uncharacterized protein BCR38DRAFT_99539 [Pseudomassariella vexata]ORY70093.1 hypothetical protein BCR38DRAFT_99539 [Pseudomassariella vexata]
MGGRGTVQDEQGTEPGRRKRTGKKGLARGLAVCVQVSCCTTLHDCQFSIDDKIAPKDRLFIANILVYTYITHQDQLQSSIDTTPTSFTPISSISSSSFPFSYLCNNPRNSSWPLLPRIEALHGIWINEQAWIKNHPTSRMIIQVRRGTLSAIATFSGSSRLGKAGLLQKRRCNMCGSTGSSPFALISHVLGF